TNAICPPETIGFYVPESDDAESYIWTLPAGWEISSGENTHSIEVTVTASAAYASGQSISVEAVNLCGNSTEQTYGNMAVGNHVVISVGPDVSVCRTRNPILIKGEVDFEGSKMKISSITSSGTGKLTTVNGNVDEFQFTYTPSA